MSQISVKQVLFMEKLTRIVIYGCPGSGKSTLATDLGLILNIEPIHLDDIFWYPNWQIPTNELFRKLVTKELQRSTWIIDGNYSHVRDLILPIATFAIIIDLPLYIPIWRLIVRTFSRNIKVIKHIPTPLPKRIKESGSKEKLLYSIYDLSRYAIKYKTRRLKSIINEVKDTLGQGRYIIFKGTNEIDIFLNKVMEAKRSEREKN
ncbi:MAG: hypothetical protein JXA54_02400 [Candidatus Heimdallarchaeota archaeon]|nr:hypothetical protein [Candidatus Heimdallarchaeota archaeon]